MTLSNYRHQSPETANDSNSITLIGCSVVVSFVTYFIFLASPIHGEIGLVFRYGIGGVLAFVGLFLYPAYRITSWPGTLTSLSLTLILFGLPLSGLWNSGTSVDSTVIGGLLPYSDALRHLPAALGLLHGNELTGGAASRPLFSGFVAFILILTQESFQATLAIIVAIVAIATFILTREIQRSKGTAIAVFTLLVIFLYYRRFSGTYLTENLGLAIGLLAFAALWHGAIEKKVWFCFLGTFLFSLALSARPAAMFLLPAIIIWGSWTFRGQFHSTFRILTTLLCAVMLAAAVSFSFTSIMGNEQESEYDGGLAHILYGNIVGGTARQLKIDYPKAHRSEYSAILWSTFRQNPIEPFTRMAASYLDYFDFDQGAAGYGFIRNIDTNPFTLQFRRLLYFLGLGELLICLIHLMFRPMMLVYKFPKIHKTSTSLLFQRNHIPDFV